MNRIIGRSKVLLALILALALGISLFFGEYLARSHNWVLHPGSPHIYYAENIGCGLIADRDGSLLADLTGQRTYATNENLRKAMLHWLGDRGGNISAPALSYYAKEIAGFDPVSGVYAYGGTADHCFGLNGYYNQALPLLEKLRTLSPDKTELWLTNLINCYYNLNMDSKVKELEKLQESLMDEGV